MVVSAGMKEWEEWRILHSKAANETRKPVHFCRLSARVT